MRFKSYSAGSHIEWRKAPGCFERHLQRRYNNPLFPEQRRRISFEELKQARAKDDNDEKEFARSYGSIASEANRLGEMGSIGDLTKCLRETQGVLELAFAIGGDLEKQVNYLEVLESKLTTLLNAKLPQGADLLKKADSLSAMKRIPFLVQAFRPDTPIVKTEELPALLSEDLETIRTVGLISRSFPNFKPNGDDVKKYLDEAVKRGLDGEYAREVIEAWNGDGGTQSNPH